MFFIGKPLSVKRPNVFQLQQLAIEIDRDNKRIEQIFSNPIQYQVTLKIQQLLQFKHSRGCQALDYTSNPRRINEIVSLLEEAYCQPVTYPSNEDEGMSSDTTESPFYFKALCTAKQFLSENQLLSSK